MIAADTSLANHMTIYIFQMKLEDSKMLLL